LPGGAAALGWRPKGGNCATGISAVGGLVWLIEFTLKEPPERL
jgi:hypothetical protein